MLKVFAETTVKDWNHKNLVEILVEALNPSRLKTGSPHLKATWAEYFNVFVKLRNLAYISRLVVDAIQ